MILFKKMFFICFICILFSGCFNNSSTTLSPELTPTIKPVSKVGMIEGIVMDSRTRDPIEGVIVELEKTKISDITDEQGKYSLTNFPGTHIIAAIKEGYKESKLTREIIAGENITENILLISLGEQNTPEETPTAKPVVKKDPLMLVTNYYSNQVMIIDLVTKTVIKKVMTGMDPEGVAICQTLGLAYVANSGDDTVSVLQLKDFSSTGHISVDEKPRAMTVVNNSLYVVSNKADKVTVIDLEQNKKIKTISVGKMPVSITADPIGQFAFVCNSRSDSVSVINTTFNSLIKNIGTGKFPSSSAVSPSGETLYVVNEVSEDLSVININTEKHIDTIPLGKIPKNCLILPSGNKLYVTNYQDNTLSIIDCNRNKIIKTIDVEYNPVGMAFSTTKKKLYVANGGANTISIIDVVSDQLTGKISEGDFPFNMVILE